jgi:serine/threonine protein kinase/Flp pilus assembly protein TadD
MNQPSHQDNDVPPAEQPTVPPPVADSRDQETLPPKQKDDQDTGSHAEKLEGAGLEHPTQPLAGPAAQGERGRLFGDYELIEEIARGGMGVVYKARQRKLNRLVALKMILAGQLASDAAVKRFYVEAEAAASLDYPGIVPIYEVGEHQGQHFFSMGFVDGESLAQRLARGPLEPRAAAGLLKAIAEAVQYAHEQGVVHRDLKPANILLSKTSTDFTDFTDSKSTSRDLSESVKSVDALPFKITDFGLARKLEGESGLTHTGDVMGTPSYMPPEQAAGKNRQIGPASDVYSLGAVLYATLTGQPPFHAETPLDTLLLVLDREPVAPHVLNPAVPRDLETICLKCLEKEPGRRYASARELADDLSRYLNDEPIAARPASTAYRLWRRMQRHRITSLAVAAALLCALVGGVLVWQSYQRAREADDKVRRIQGADIREVAIIPFKNLSGNLPDDWLGGAFASELESRLSGNAALKVVGQSPIGQAVAALGLPAGSPLDAAQAQRLGKRLVVSHVITGEFTRIGDQLQVSAKVVNVETGSIDRGGLQVRGKFPDEVFDLQTKLASLCLSALGIAAKDAEKKPAAAPAASVDAWILFGQGKHALDNRDYDEAIRLLKKAVAKDAKLGTAYRALGMAYAHTMRNEEAIAAYKKAIELNSDDLISLAFFNMLSGRVAEGIEAFDKASTSGAADLDVYKASLRFRTNVLASMGEKLDPLIQELKDALIKHEDDSGLWEALAAAYQAAGKEEEAIDSLNKAIELKPEDTSRASSWRTSTKSEASRRPPSASIAPRRSAGRKGPAVFGNSPACSPSRARRTRRSRRLNRPLPLNRTMASPTPSSARVTCRSPRWTARWATSKRVSPMTPIRRCC